MAEMATLARPYANAVFDLAKSDRALDQWSKMLGLLAGAAGEPQVQTLLEAPDVADDQKAFRLADVFGDQVNDRAKKFLSVLASNKRLGLLGEIAEQFEVLRAQEEQSLDVEVISAFALVPQQEQALKEALQRKFAKEVSLTSRVDSTLVGGAVIRAGDMVLDGSVRGKLDKLKETLLKT